MAIPKGYRFSIKFSEAFVQGLALVGEHQSDVFQATGFTAASAAGGRSGQTGKTAGSESIGKAA